MVIAIALGAAFVTVTGFIVGWILADHFFWNRQNYMEKINREF